MEFFNRIDSYTWESIPITEERCPHDKALEDLIGKLKEQTDAKYGRIITRLPCEYTHPCRNRETELGDLLAEGIREQLKMNGKEVQDDDVYLVALERYYYNCMKQALDVSPEEVEKNGAAVKLAGTVVNVLEEYLMNHEFTNMDTEPRLIIHD